ncbi:cellulase-like family protein [Cryobacterium algoricola]|uniref:cellulase-like family protein n=1 Tax=Cryobacterium algoricola TaxID=1259183 RepID=UPI001580A86B|nr:cellulase-like family protein [Cryobacterium algoricola]
MSKAASGDIPAHLPARLVITLWDFSWYTQAGPGEPFADLDRAFAEAAERGYNTVRICAAPLYLFGPNALPADLAISGFGPRPGGGSFGDGTRWYNVTGGYSVPLLQRLLALFAAARRHGFVVILSSWEYQQSPAFAADDRWWRAIDAVPFAERMDALASANITLLHVLDDNGCLDLVAFLELHNEVDFSRVPTDGATLERAVQTVSRQFPGILTTVSYGKPPHPDWESLPADLQVGQFHIYAYGVLDALQQTIDIRGSGTEDFPNTALRGLLRPGAPAWADAGRPEGWRFDATVVTDQMLYGYDNVDPDGWDLWLYDRYAPFRDRMHGEIRSRVAAAAAWGRQHSTPVVFGEGWVGYTPLHAGFEEGPVGKDLAETGLHAAVDNGAWGAVLSSNAAPQHPLWADVAWQRRASAILLG